MHDAKARWARNPFFVLNLPTDCSRADIERAAQKLLGLLGVGASSAKVYATPFGPMERTEDMVRQAAAELRDPSKRVAHELWARVPTASEKTPSTATQARWEGVFGLFRWRAPVDRDAPGGGGEP